MERHWAFYEATRQTNSISFTWHTWTQVASETTDFRTRCATGERRVSTEQRADLLLLPLAATIVRTQTPQQALFCSLPCLSPDIRHMHRPQSSVYDAFPVSLLQENDCHRLHVQHWRNKVTDASNLGKQHVLRWQFITFCFLNHSTTASKTLVALNGIDTRVAFGMNIYRVAWNAQWLWKQSRPSTTSAQWTQTNVATFSYHSGVSTSWRTCQMRSDSRLTFGLWTESLTLTVRSAGLLGWAIMMHLPATLFLGCFHGVAEGVPQTAVNVWKQSGLRALGFLSVQMPWHEPPWRPHVSGKIFADSIADSKEQEFICWTAMSKQVSQSTPRLTRRKLAARTKDEKPSFKAKLLWCRLKKLKDKRTAPIPKKRKGISMCLADSFGKVTLKVLEMDLRENDIFEIRFYFWASWRLKSDVSKFQTSSAHHKAFTGSFFTKPQQDDSVGLDDEMMPGNLNSDIKMYTLGRWHIIFTRNCLLMRRGLLGNGKHVGCFSHKTLPASHAHLQNDGPPLTNWRRRVDQKKGRLKLFFRTRRTGAGIHEGCP